MQAVGWREDAGVASVTVERADGSPLTLPVEDRASYSAPETLHAGILEHFARAINVRLEDVRAI
jgi:hypothetical protein